jgi:hypothetical protein
VDKAFPDMTFDERVAWARGYLLVSVGEGNFQNAVWTVCHQFTLWPKPRNTQPPLRRPKSKYERLQRVPPRKKAKSRVRRKA